jgi:hypothetical protein
MPNPKNRTRGRKPWVVYTVISLAVLLAVGLTWRFGFPDHFSSVFAGDKKQESRAGKVAILIAPAQMQAFTAIDPAAFIDPRTGDFMVAWIAEKAANDGGFIRDPAAIRGRVLKRDKAVGLGFSEADFFPRGSQPSLTSALEPGQRSVHLDASEIEGLRSLKRFDHFDLYAVKLKARANTNGAAYMDPDAARIAAQNGEWETDRLVIAQNAMILVPVPEGKNAKNPDAVEVAMTMEEATALADAKAKGAKILCLGSSGKPGGDKTPLMAPEGPALDTIQVHTGATASTTVVRSKKNDAEMPKQDDPPR